MPFFIRFRLVINRDDYNSVLVVELASALADFFELDPLQVSVALEPSRRLLAGTVFLMAEITVIGDDQADALVVAVINRRDAFQQFSADVRQLPPVQIAADSVVVRDSSNQYPVDVPATTPAPPAPAPRPGFSDAARAGPRPRMSVCLAPALLVLVAAGMARA